MSFGLSMRFVWANARVFREALEDPPRPIVADWLVRARVGAGAVFEVSRCS